MCCHSSPHTKPWTCALAKRLVGLRSAMTIRQSLSPGQGELAGRDEEVLPVAVGTLGVRLQVGHRHFHRGWSRLRLRLRGCLLLLSTSWRAFPTALNWILSEQRANQARKLLRPRP